MLDRTIAATLYARSLGCGIPTHWKTSVTLKAVILNDTRGDNHFGCFRVMRIIEENLAARGILVTARSLVRNDWGSDRAFLDAMAEADVIVINGEGTLHHGSRLGERLLSVVGHPARGDTPVALINALYQENPPSWGRFLERFDLISTRDSWSAEVASEHAKRKVGHVPDLSLAGGMLPSPATPQRDLLLVGDSVSRSVSHGLLALMSGRPNAYLLPITKTIKSSKPDLPAPLRALRQGYARLHASAFGLRHRRVLFNRTESEFIEDLLRGRLHVTGRFHSVCFCLFTGTPFLAVESNSWKIGALLNDFGFGSSRLTTLEDIRERIEQPEKEEYSPEELDAVGLGLARVQKQAGLVFDEIRKLAEGHANGAPVA